MRWRLLILAAAAPLLGCQLKERRLPAARLEIEVRPEVRQAAVTFDFARTRSSGGVLYGHKASFVATEKVQRVAFEQQQQQQPERWTLTWEDAATDARHSISVAVRSRGKAPEIEVLAASGRSLGTHLGPAVQLYLLPDGSVTTQSPARRKPAAAPRQD